MAGIAPRPCLGRCGRLVRGASRCDDCAREHERNRTARRSESEPWRLLYRRPEWKYAAGVRRATDRYSCVDCGAPATQVDHEIPLRVLWRECGGFAGLDEFVERATEIDDLRTRCQSCHATVENARNR